MDRHVLHAMFLRRLQLLFLQRVIEVRSVLTSHLSCPLYKPPLGLVCGWSEHICPLIMQWPYMLITAFSLHPVPPASGAFAFLTRTVSCIVPRLAITCQAFTWNCTPPRRFPYACPAVGAHSGSTSSSSSSSANLPPDVYAGHPGQWVLTQLRYHVVHCAHRVY